MTAADKKELLQAAKEFIAKLKESGYQFEETAELEPLEFRADSITADWKQRYGLRLTISVLVK